MASCVKDYSARAARSTLSQLLHGHRHCHLQHFSLQPSRFISNGTKLFVGGLAAQTSEDQLRDAFSSFGEITEAKIVLDNDSGKSKGYGFIRFSSANHADLAIKTMNGRSLFGKTLRVGSAVDRPRAYGGSGPGGGYGGSRYSDGGDYSSGHYGGGDGDGGGGDGGYGYR